MRHLVCLCMKCAPCYVLPRNDQLSADRLVGKTTSIADPPQSVPLSTAERECAPPNAYIQGCIRREGTSEAALEAVRQAVGGGCQGSWGRLLSVTNVIEAGTWRQGDSGWA